MKIGYQFVSAFVLFLAVLFTVTSCSQDDSVFDLEEDKAKTEVFSRGDGGGVGPDGPGVGHDAWYTHITCEPISGPVAELKEYFETFEICQCHTLAWEYDNCEPGGAGVNYAWCQNSTSPNVPFGGICN